MFPIAGFAQENLHIGEALAVECAIEFLRELGDFGIGPTGTLLVVSLPGILRLVDGRNVGDRIAPGNVLGSDLGHIAGKVVVAVGLEVGRMTAVAVALAVARELHVGRIAEEDDALDAIVLGLVEEEALALATRPVVGEVVVEVTLAATIVVVAIGSVLDANVAGKALFGRTASQVAAPHRKTDALGLSVAYLTAEKEFGNAIALAGPVLADDGRCPAIGGCKAFHGLIGHRRIDDTGEDSLCLLDRDSGCELAQSIGEGGRTGSTRVGFGLEATLVLARSCSLGDPSGINDSFTAFRFRTARSGDRSEHDPSVNRN